VTSDLAIGRRVRGAVRSVRQRLAAVPRAERWLIVLLIGATAVYGVRLLAPVFARDDLLYHWGLTNTILLGEFPAEGPYAGLPAYYPPGFHLLLAGLARLLGTDAPTATVVLGLIWLPVIPLGAYLLTRRLTGRRDVALVAAVFTAFAGGFDLSDGGLWVNSMFMVGQAFYPIYPRDLVFGLLPFAMLAFLRATDDDPTGSRVVAWAALAGVVLGICGLIQIQLLIPVPFTLALLVVVVGLRHPGRWGRLVGVLLVTGLTPTILVGPWLAYVAATIQTNGGVAIDSSADLVAARIGFWQYPIQFGLILPLAVVGAGVALSFLRRPSGPAPADDPGRWSPRPLEAPLLLLPWWLVPFTLAVLYQPTWPLEDALRPQRMWMVSSQPALILAAIGLVSLAEIALRRGLAGTRLVAAGLVVTLLVACVPTTVATERLLFGRWTDARYADLELGPDRVPDMSELLIVDGPRPTILTYEDWSSLVWYDTGASVVAVLPPGYAKLAFDPAVFTGVGQDQRRRDLASALTGDKAALTAVADRYGADRIVLGRRGEKVGRISRVAALASAEPGATAGTTRILPGNGWDAVALEPGSRLAFSLASQGEPIDLEIRVLSGVAPASDTGPIDSDQDDGADDSIFGTGPDPTTGSLGPGGTPETRRFRVLAGDRLVDEISVPYTEGNDFQVVRSTVTLAPGERLVVEALDRIAVQSVTGYLPDDGPPPGWQTLTETDDAVVWARSR
jgi:hypothetical protein